MNFRKITPLIIFGLFYLTCLVSQIYAGDYGTHSLCETGQQVTADSFEEDNRSGEIEFQREMDEFVIEEVKQDIEDEISSYPVQVARKEGHLTSSSNERKFVQNKSCRERLLQTSYTTSNKFIIASALLFRALILVTRNLILVGIFTNSLDLFLPFLILSESFLMVAFWTSQKHYLTNLYTSIFSSYWDIFNAIRLIAQPSTDTANLGQLSQYGFGSIALFNLSGEIFVAILLLVFTVLSKMTAVCLKYERLRRMASNLRAIWNGYFFAILPRVATFTGLHWRLIGIGAGFDALNVIVCITLSAVIVFFFIMLIIQTRRINEKPDQIEEKHHELGLTRRINFKKRFQFDCLRYSSLYYPAMNYVRLVIYFLPIGLSWDFYYASYGGAIISQLLIMMMEVSSTGYILLRDKILFALQNFLMIIVQLCIIAVGLAESVSHSEVSEIAETILFAVLLFVLGSSLIGIGLDSWAALSEKCSEEEEQEVKKDDESAHDFLRKMGKSGTVSSSKKSDDSDEQDSVKNEDIIEKSSISYPKTTEKLTHTLKIKKVRKGKVI